MNDFALAFRFARRDLRGGLKGLRLLIACLILGVAAIAGVGSLSSAILSSLAEQGQELLGGDVELRTTNHEITADQLKTYRQFGTVSRTAELSAMVRNPKNEAATLVQLKAVDGLYPLYGKFTLASGAPARSRLNSRGVVMDESLAARLAVNVGDVVQIGFETFYVRGVIGTEPDKAGEGFALGPSVIMAISDLAQTGLIQPGSLVRYHYRLKLDAGTAIKTVTDHLGVKYPDADWRITDRNNGAPGVRRFVDQLGQFLTLVGLTSLMVSGLGVANAVSAHLERKTGSIATLKSLGASSSLIFRVYLIGIFLVAAVAICIGLIAGSLVPVFAVQFLADKIPVPSHIGIYPGALALAAAFGVLVALAATIWPLARARETSPSRLFRARIAGLDQQPQRRFLLLILLAIALAVALAIFVSNEKLLAMGVIGGGAALIVLLRGIAAGISAIAQRLPAVRQPLLRLGIANLHRPGSSAPAVVTALGLGLSLFATLAAVEANLSHAVAQDIPKQAPAFFFIDVPGDQIDRFKQAVLKIPGTRNLVTVPSLRGPVTRINDIAVEDFKPVRPKEAWVLHGDRGLTYAAEFPKGNKLVAGKWWPKNYAGPPLLSFDAEQAAALGIGVGDTVTASVLGMDVTAKIASLRQIDWRTFGFNFVMLFAPGALDDAPHGYMATVEATEPASRIILRQISKTYPTVSIIRIKEVMTRISDLLGQISTAIRATALVTVLAGILVLIGAISMVQQARTYDSVILKMLGATRRQVLTAYLTEYLLLGATAGLIAVAAGAAAGWFVVTLVLELDWIMPWAPLAMTTFGGAALTILLSLAGAFTVLRARPNQSLRSTV
jgi:putative ABC transport system permease protein